MVAGRPAERRVSDPGTRSEGPPPDGRLLRSERSRAKMVEAMYELVGEGELSPTARQVADRAGVGIRTVFRHFSDMETLFAEMNGLLLEEAGPFLAAEPPEGGLTDRVIALVRSRARSFERFEPYLRSTRLYRARSPFLQESYTRFLADQSAMLRCWLPELEGAPGDWADAMEAATCFEQWDDLRSTRGLGKARSRAVMERMARALAADLG
jgi:AcrR family transcriptional regulator